MTKQEKKQVLDSLLAEVRRVSCAAIDAGMEEDDPVTQIQVICNLLREEMEHNTVTAH